MWHIPLLAGALLLTGSALAQTRAENAPGQPNPNPAVTGTVSSDPSTVRSGSAAGGNANQPERAAPGTSMGGSAGSEGGGAGGSGAGGAGSGGGSGGSGSQ